MDGDGCTGCNCGTIGADLAQTASHTLAAAERGHAERPAQDYRAEAYGVEESGRAGWEWQCEGEGGVRRDGEEEAVEV